MNPLHPLADGEAVAAGFKKQIPISWGALALAFLIVPTLPRWVLLGIAPWLGTIAYYVHGDGRRTAFANLAAAFPGRFDQVELERTVRACYRSWARTYLDQFWTRRITEENYREYTTYHLPDSQGLEEARKTGAIWMMPHYGNFEWGANNVAFLGFHYTAIAQDFKNERLTDIFRQNREFHGHQLIPQEKAMLKLLRVLRRGGNAAFLPDLTVRPSQAATIIKVFGLKASVTILGAFLVKRTGVPVLTGLCFPCHDGTYFVEGLPALRFSEEATAQEIAQACWDAVEPKIAAHPEHWLWMYKHFRFRPANDAEAERYPFYAHRSRAFNKLESTVESGAQEASLVGD
ncbi:MAG: Lauroyl/myristoyl acyltransferase [Verrucomicrobia bacterium]|nr:MAG: Lauroyl/myristoyl acyltransferase [Verrucomicrobiota bacterium]